jgi:hypothetical protein
VLYQSFEEIGRVLHAVRPKPQLSTGNLGKSTCLGVPWRDLQSRGPFAEMFFLESVGEWRVLQRGRLVSWQRLRLRCSETMDRQQLGI